MYQREGGGGTSELIIQNDFCCESKSLHNEELLDLCRLPGVVRIVKERKKLGGLSKRLEC
jgi:hypothetical protein